MRLVAIDPSKRGLGLATGILSTVSGALHVLDVWQIEDAHAVESSADHGFGGWHAEAVAMAETVAATLAPHTSRIVGQRVVYDPIVLAIETPTNWFTDKGMDSKNSEAIQKLYFTTGAVVTTVFNTVDKVVAVWGVAPGDWKGQTPKPVMVDRARTFAKAKAVKQIGAAPDELLEKLTKHDACEALMLMKHAAEHTMTNIPAGVYLRKPWSLIRDRNRICRRRFTVANLLHLAGAVDPKK